MQSLNDDMDELFRRASEEYPLNTNGADWNKVMQQLHHKEGDLPDEDKKKKDYKFLWLFLLLPIGFICGRYMDYNNQMSDDANKKVITTPAAPHKTQPATSATGAADMKTRAENSNSQNEDGQKYKDGIGKVNTRTTASAGSNTGQLKSKSTITSKLHTQSEADALPMKTAMLKEPEKINRNSNGFSDNITRQPGKIKNKEDVTTSNVPAAVQDKQPFNSSLPPLQPDTSITKTDKKSDGAPATEKSNESSRKPKISTSKLSYSLIFGPDVSTVKKQKTSNVGYSLGIMLRYQFAGRLSVEAGVLWDRKNYYTEGRFFDTSKLKLPSRSTVKNADGYCNMFEIPLNIRYELITKKNSSWFISTGLSSYIMKEEKYDLTYERYNQLYTKAYDYKNSSKHWFSVMNLSVGYQKSLGKRTTIGIAPYIKLPLGKVGVGKLPLTSTGIYFSVGRSLQ